nr:hypothetical protein BaRGS_006257 [Batillaria attramentaria]
MEEFREAWNTLWINCSYPPPEVTDHPWLQELHALHKGSNCQALRLKPAEELLYPWYHVQAAAVFAAVIKRKHAQDCAGASVPCTKFLSHLRELTSQQIMLQRSLDLEAEFLNISSAFYGVTDVRFSSSGEVLVGTDHEETLYEIHNFRTCGGDSQFCFRKVGNFFDGNISLNYSQTEAYPPDTTGPVTPTSVSPKLSDRQEHPYFMRLTVPANSEITAMLDILNTVNASFVQIIFNPDDAYSVDLTQTVRVPVKSKISQYYPILDTLRVKNSARLVIVILQYEQVIKVMEAMVEVLTAEDRFLFLGSEAWAGRLEVVRGRSRLSGSITLAEEIALDQNFTTYFRHTNPVTSRNFWLRDYWEAKENCFFDGSFQRKDKSSQCPDDVQMRYDQDPWVSYFVQAVYAFAEGVGNALRSACSESATTLCASLKSEQIVREERPVFDSNGDGGERIQACRVETTARRFL